MAESRDRLITVALLFIASLPWVGPILKGLADSGVRNLELPGGIKIELTDIKAATDKVTRGHAVVTAHATVSAKGHKVSQSEEDSFSYIREISKADSNLSLVAFMPILSDYPDIQAGRRKAVISITKM